MFLVLKKIQKLKINKVFLIYIIKIFFLIIKGAREKKKHVRTNASGLPQHPPSLHQFQPRDLQKGRAGCSTVRSSYGICQRRLECPGRGCRTVFQPG